METASLSTAQWPVASLSLLADMEKLAASYSDPACVNQALLSLIRARKAIMDARLALLHARRFYPVRPEVRARLEELATALDTAHARFPLTVLDNGGGHARPTIFPRSGEGR